MTDLFMNRTNLILTKVLDGTATRQRALANNIANAETPGYTRQTVSFEGELLDIMRRADVHPDQQLSAFQGVTPAISDDVQSARRPDGNNVNIDREMVTLAENTLQYDVTARFLSERITGLRNAIKEGRG